MYEVDMRALEHLKERRRMLRTKLAESCNNRKAAKERGDEKTISRERIRAAYLTTFITRLNDEIFAMSRALGVDPEGVGEPSE